MSRAEQAVACAALANQESIQESKLRAMRGAVDLYRGRLGLEFRKGALCCESPHIITTLFPFCEIKSMSCGICIT